MRNDILIGIIITLLNEGKCSYAQLAEKFEVSKKTIQRYMEVLEMAGVPTISHQGRYGGTEIISSFSLENAFFTKQELSRLLTHLKASPLSSLDNIDKQIEEKLELNLKNKPDLIPTNDYIIDYTSWGTTKPNSPLIKFLKEKLNTKQTFSITYVTPSSVVTKRVISPQKLVFKDFKWYLLAYCHKRQEVRIFKLKRIQELTPSNEEFIELNMSQEEIIEHLNNFFASTILELQFKECMLADVEEWLTDITFLTKPNNNGLITIRGTSKLGSALIDKLIASSNSVTVLKPLEVINKIKNKCNEIYQKYNTKAQP